MVLEAAKIDRLLGSWGLPSGDPNDQYGLDGKNTASRGEWLYDNDAIVRALTECILGDTVGANGLQLRSMYQSDPHGEASDLDGKIRRQIEGGIEAGTKSKRFDAGCVHHYVEMAKVVLASTIANGIGVSVRESYPCRPDRPSHSTCWRLVHSLRVSNPGFGPNNFKYRDGFELDDRRNPVAIHVQRTHPNTKWIVQQFTWDRVPLYDSEGWPNVTIHAQRRIADQLRPVGWLSPVIQLLRLFGRTVEAKVVADVLKASMGLIIESPNPAAAAAADTNGAVLKPTTKIIPGKCYYVKTGTVVKPLNFDYQGEGFDKWQEAILTNICAALRVPYEFVMMRLTRTNMASSRVALAQAYRTFSTYQEDLIQSTIGPWMDSLIREDVLRGRIDLPLPAAPEAWDGIVRARYMRPPRHMPDPAKEVQAAILWCKKMGKSYSSAFAEAGMDFDDQVPQLARDNKVLETHGIVLESDSGPAAAQIDENGEPIDPDQEQSDGTAADPDPGDDAATNAPAPADDKVPPGPTSDPADMQRGGSSPKKPAPIGAAA